MSEILCPKCGEACEGEPPDHPWFLQCECECGFEFAYDTYIEEFYDMNGNVIKGVE